MKSQETKSSDTSPGFNAGIAPGLPHDSPMFALSGSAANSSVVYPRRLP